MPPSRRRLCLRAFTALAVALAVLLALRLAAAGAPGRSPTPFAVPARVDLNRARIAELMTLPGIGRTRAAAIVLHRVRHGPFTDPLDLLRVDGIGPGTVEGLRPLVVQGLAR